MAAATGAAALTAGAAAAAPATVAALVAASALAAGAATLDSRASVSAPEVVVGASVVDLLAAAPGLTGPYVPLPLLRNAHTNTVLPVFLRRRPAGLVYARECVPMADGGFVTLDWPSVLVPSTAAAAPDPALPADAPLLLLLSGIAGGSSDIYVQQMAASALRQGFRPVAMNQRGCAGGPVTVPRFYSACWTSDLREVVPLLARRHPGAPLVALGWSLGANILTNYAAEEGPGCALAGAVSMCNPFDLAACDAALAVPPFGPAYARSMGASLRRVFAPHAPLFARSAGGPGVDPGAAGAAATVRDFDAALTAPSFGFPSVDAYYAHAGSGQRVARVGVPLLCVSAADDPIALASAIPRAALAANPLAALVVTPFGGHLGWLAGASARGGWGGGALASVWCRLGRS